MSRKTHLYLLPLSAVLVAALLAGCEQKTPAGGPGGGKGAVEIGVQTLSTQPVALTTELAGRTAASLSADVRPQVAGIVKARKFEEGAAVKAGQVLYEVDGAPYLAALDQAKASLANAQASQASAQAKSDRYASLLHIEGVSKQDADDALAAARQATANVALQRAAVKVAEINVGYTLVRAPISGRIGKSSVTAGALVTANQADALATIRALDPIFVDVTQSSSALLKLRKQMAAGAYEKGGADVSLQLEDGTAYSHKGQLKFTEVAVDEASGTVTLRAQFPNPEGTLLPGMYVRAAMADAVDPKGLLVPQTALSRNAKGEATAITVDAVGNTKTVIVGADRAIGDKWLVTSGLAAGDRVVVQGSNKIRPGAKVNPVEVAGAAAKKGG